MISSLLLLIGIALCIYKFYKWATYNYDLFERQGLAYEKPFPLLGNSLLFTFNKAISDRVFEKYNNHPNEDIVGLFDFRTPLFFIRNPEIAKQLAVKDFGHFQDHTTFVDADNDALFGNALFFMRGEQWRNMRITLSPIFTGRKMKLMLQLIVKTCNQMVDYIKEEYEKNGLKPFKVKDLNSRYATDVIATCAFGIECNSLKNPNNDVLTVGREFLKLQSPLLVLKFLILRSQPLLSKIMGITLMSKRITNIFQKLIIDTMNIRQREGIVRPDMLQLLMKLRQGQSIDEDKENLETNSEAQILKGTIKKSWTDIELIAQCFLFFSAGFNTGSEVMGFCYYELATNPDVQEKLIQEVDETFDSLEGEPLSYEAMKKMKYMHMFISEVLRRWPQAPFLDRLCTKDFVYDNEKGLKFNVNKGNIIWIPVYGFHMDPKYFPEPEKFDPERFSEENRSNINMDAYLPFGIGPRNCIGLRFALMEIKALLYHMLCHFQFKVCQETVIPLKLKKLMFGMTPEKEIQLYLEPRNKK